MLKVSQWKLSIVAIPRNSCRGRMNNTRNHDRELYILMLTVVFGNLYEALGQCVYFKIHLSPSIKGRNSVIILVSLFLEPTMDVELFIIYCIANI